MFGAGQHICSNMLLPAQEGFLSVPQGLEDANTDASAARSVPKVSSRLEENMPATAALRDRRGRESVSSWLKIGKAGEFIFEVGPAQLDHGCHNGSELDRSAAPEVGRDRWTGDQYGCLPDASLCQAELVATEVCLGRGSELEKGHEGEMHTSQ
jgi:hypothetical protein